METGIYTITNLIDNKVYVGSARTTFKKRKNHHFHHLRKGTHGNKYLQYAWNKYGESNFIFEILEEILPEHCISLETYWCNLLESLNPKYGYNIELPQIGAYGLKRSNETKRKISEKLTGRTLSKEIKEKISKTTKGNKYISSEQKLIISKTHKGKIISEETRKKMKLNSPKTKPTHFKSINQYNKNMQIVKNWPSIGHAVRELNISYTSISNNLSGRSRTAGGFLFKYAS